MSEIIIDADVSTRTNATNYDIADILRVANDEQVTDQVEQPGTNEDT